VTKMSLRDTPLRLMARPTASSLPYDAAVSMSRCPACKASTTFLLALGEIGHLKDPEAKKRHLGAVAECDLGVSM
jgi:hypothetical protein